MSISGGLLVMCGAASAEWAGPILDKASEKLFGGAAKRVLEQLQARIRAHTGELPVNHDLERSIRLAELTSTLMVLAAYRHQDEIDRADTRGTLPPPFIKAAHDWLLEQVNTSLEVSDQSNDALIVELNQRLDDMLVVQNRNEAQTILAEAALHVWDSLKKEVGEPPAMFAEIFFGDDSSTPSWAVTFLALMREALKDNPRAEIAFVTTRLGALRSTFVRLEPKLATLEGSISTLLRVQNDLCQEVAALPDAVVKKLIEAIDKGYVHFAESRGLTQAKIEEILRAFGKEGLAPDQWGSELVKSARRLAELEAVSRTQRDHDSEISVLLDEAAKATDAAEYDRADELYEKAVEADLAVDEVRARRAAETLGKRGVLAGALARFKLATTLYGRAADLLAKYDADAAWHWRMAQANSLVEHAELFPGTNSLLEAIEVFEKLCLPLAPLNVQPVNWSTTQNDLGNAFRLLGIRIGGEAGSTSLESALDALRAALSVRTRDELPYDWAMTQSNLGSVLHSIGDRESDEKSPVALRQAINAYLAALQIYGRDDTPIEWARTLNNLGNVQKALGVLLSDDEGLQFLRAAVGTFDAALTVRTRQDFESDWADTQNNLGVALNTLGGRLSGPIALDTIGRAIDISRSVLKIFGRERSPINWAMAQHNLGSALSSIGERKGGAEGRSLLIESTAAYRAALEVRTKDATPTEWAMTQTNLSDVSRIIGASTAGEAGITFLRDAIAAARAALEVYSRQYTPGTWAGAQNNLGNALAVFGTRVGSDVGREALDSALASFRAAQEVYTLRAMPALWAKMENNIGNTLTSIAQFLPGSAAVETLGQAIDAFQAASKVYTRDATPADWALTQYNLGYAFAALSKRSPKEEQPQHLRSAIESYKLALEVRTRDAMPSDWTSTSENLAIAEAELSGRSLLPDLMCGAIERMNEVLEEYARMRASAKIEQATKNRELMKRLLRNMRG